MKRNVQPSLPVLAWAALLMLLQATAIRAQSASSPPRTPPAKLADEGHVLKDKDGHTYTSKIMLDGNRWMTQNLNTKVTGSYCFEDQQENCDRYGRLYTWEAAKKVCQMLGDGWRLPANDEWRALAKQYGGVRDDAGETGKSAYKALLVGGNSEFNALLVGNRDPDGKYFRFDAHGFYWSATEHSTGEAWFLNFGKGSQALYLQNGGEKSRAWSVRCIRP